jgi:hypothetical protein
MNIKKLGFIGLPPDVRGLSRSVLRLRLSHFAFWNAY